MMEDNMRKRMHIYIYDWVTMLYGRNWHSNYTFKNQKKKKRKEIQLAYQYLRLRYQVSPDIGCFLKSE